MALSVQVLLLIALAVLAANLPFLVNDRWMGVWRMPNKGLALRCLELLLYYGLVGGVGLWMEWRAGQIYPQGWAFYAITGAMFLTFAFPGFVYRYLGRR